MPFPEYMVLKQEVNVFLMWSHYADGHRGFCLEFNRNIKPFSNAVKVDYSSGFHAFNIGEILSGDITYKVEMLKLKVERWKYEKELRIIEDEKTDSIEFPIECLTGIYFGIAMPPERKRILTVLIKSIYPRTNIYDTNQFDRTDGFYYYPVELDNHLMLHQTGPFGFIDFGTY